MSKEFFSLALCGFLNRRSGLLTSQHHFLPVLASKYGLCLVKEWLNRTHASILQ